MNRNIKIKPLFHSLKQHGISDAEIFIRWIPIAGTNTWQETNNTIYDEEINPVYEYEVPPINYTQFLPAANAYDKGHVMRVRPYIIATEGDGEYLEEYDNDFILTTAKYYTIV